MIDIRAGDFLLFGRKLVGLMGRLHSRMSGVFLDGAQKVAQQARSNASWSTRIPGAVRVTRGGGGAFVTVDEDVAPHARPFEGIAGGGSTFRHPVFGRAGTWVLQRHRPFLVPAVEQHEGSIVRDVDQVVDDQFDRM